MTPRAVELARARLVNHKDRLCDVDEDAATLRVALILVREMSPDAYLTNEETALLIGLSAVTVGKLKSAGEL